MSFIEAWDIGTRDGLEPLHRPWLTHGMRFISALGNSQVLAVVALLSMLFFIFIGRWRTGLCLVAAGLLGYGIEHAVKPWVNRQRPDVKWVEPRDRQTSPSFPSGHALLAMAVYASLALSVAAEMESRKAKGLVVAVGLFLPLAIGFSRMYLGVHYLSDVVGGFCAGLGCVFLFRWIDQTWSTAFRPRLVETITTSAPLPPPHSPKAPEQIRRPSDEQIQS